MSPTLFAYRRFMALAAPLLSLLLRARTRRGKEDPNRLAERRGQPSLPRPTGQLVWIHAASVGESLAVLPLVTALRAQRPDLILLVSTGTVTSAKLLASRLPDQVLHQYIPVDQPHWVASFLDYWRPSLALWIESEIWPNLLLAAHARRIPVWLLNARLSPLAESRWRRRPRAAQTLFSKLSGVLAQSLLQAKLFQDLGVYHVETLANLKFASIPPSAKGQMPHTQQTDRSIWLALSTHSDDEEAVLYAHARVLRAFPQALLLLAPRHPSRTAEVCESLERAGLSYLRFSEAAEIRPDQTQASVLLIDTLGQLDKIYPYAQVCLVGGSFGDTIGGHSPIEPAHYANALIFGPKMAKQVDLVERFIQGDAAQQVETADELADLVEGLLGDATARSDWQARALELVQRESQVLDFYLEALKPHLPTLLEPQ